MRKWMMGAVVSAGLIACSTPKEPVELNVASFNLRLNTMSDSLNAWPYRAQQVKDLIRFHEFEVFGVQEALPEQMDFLATMTEFSYAGKGRDDGERAGEHSAVFYRNDRFTALDKGDFWFSETPDVPSKGWDATCCNRICSWVKLKEKSSGKELIFFSAHFDHEGAVAQLKSAEMMIDKINKIGNGLPAIFVGDLNSVPTSDAYRVLSDKLKDAASVSETDPYGPEGTFNAFRWNRIPEARIDYIFVNDPVSVSKYAVLTDSKEMRYPSDHFPVFARVRID
ncbi:MAG: endonuclease/exonuclease/phosphatase family protein [Bacteroidales bacterium]